MHYSPRNRSCVRDVTLSAAAFVAAALPGKWSVLVFRPKSCNEKRAVTCKRRRLMCSRATDHAQSANGQWLGGQVRLITDFHCRIEHVHVHDAMSPREVLQCVRFLWGSKEGCSSENSFAFDHPSPLAWIL